MTIKIFHQAIILFGVFCLFEVGHAQSSNKTLNAENADAAFNDVNKLTKQLGVELPTVPQSIQIGTESYKLSELINDFIDIAISKHGWLDDTINPDQFIPLYTKSYEETKRLHPLIAEYLHRKKGYPELQAINKWDEEISIGIGWQKVKIQKGNGEWQEIPVPGFGGDDSNSDHYIFFRDQIRSLMPEIKSLTGLPVTFIESDDTREVNIVNDPGTGAQHARIRIVPTPFINTRNSYDTHRSGTIEPYFLAGVAFTPFEIGQVDGYFLPDSDNTIGFAVCRIDPDLPENLVRALITECLVRSLGLPNLSHVNERAAVGAWNRKAGVYLEEFIKKKHKQTNKAKFRYPDHLVNTYDLEKGFSAYDQFMIALLYCAAIRPGMNLYEVEQFLYKNSECFPIKHEQKE